MVGRELILPAYLLSQPVWAEMTRAIDKIFKKEIDDPTRWVQWIRDFFVQDELMKAGVESGSMLSLADFNNYDRELLIKLVNLLGWTFRSSDFLTEDDYLRILRNLPSYWQNPGNETFIDFYSLVINSPFEIKNLWTQDYVTFVPEDDPSIGVPIYAGGTWYPTTHIDLSYDALNFPVSINKAIEFLYFLDPYNLVLRSLTSKSVIKVQPIGIAMVGQMHITYL